MKTHAERQELQSVRLYLVALQMLHLLFVKNELELPVALEEFYQKSATCRPKGVVVKLEASKIWQLQCQQRFQPLLSKSGGLQIDPANLERTWATSIILYSIPPFRRRAPTAQTAGCITIRVQALV